MAITGDHVAAKIGGMIPVLVPGLQSWRATGRVKELNGQTAETQGFEKPEPGSRSCEVSLKLVIDITTGDLVTLEEGTIITDLKLYADVDATTPVYHFPSALVLSAAPGGEMQGTFSYDVSVKSRGPFTYADPN